jgi:hypothetical protein
MFLKKTIAERLNQIGDDCGAGGPMKKTISSAIEADVLAVCDAQVVTYLLKHLERLDLPRISPADIRDDMTEEFTGSTTNAGAPPFCGAERHACVVSLPRLHCLRL